MNKINSSKGSNLILSTFITVSLYLCFSNLYMTLNPSYNNESGFQYPILFWLAISWPFLIVFIILEIIGIVRIAKWKTENKYKAILLTTWIILNIAYLISFYILYSLKKINKWTFEKAIAIKRIRNHSIVLFSFINIIYFYYFQMVIDYFWLIIILIWIIRILWVLWLLWNCSKFCGNSFTR